MTATERIADKKAGKGGGAQPPGRSFEMSGGVQVSDAQYRKLAQLVYELSGINLGDHKKELLKARLAKRIRALKCPDLKQYMNKLSDPSGQELVNFLDVITTNKTDFFREPQHFDFVVNHILPDLNKICGQENDFRIWSAACSTGEEPYTLGIVLAENHSALGGRRAMILASDLSTKVLNSAQQGVYSQDRVAIIPRPVLSRYFQKGVKSMSGQVRVRPEIKAMIKFTRINLMHQFKFEKLFHLIFCRNVMIYFDKPTQETLIGKMHQCLVSGGYLFVGHSESLAGINHKFKFIKPAIYRKGS